MEDTAGGSKRKVDTGSSQTQPTTPGGIPEDANRTEARWFTTTNFHQTVQQLDPAQLRHDIISLADHTKYITVGTINYIDRANGNVDALRGGDATLQQGIEA